MNQQINPNYIQALGEWVQPFECAPGVDRDSTILDKKAFIDGQWVRFDSNRARKMGGYEAIFSGSSEPIRAIYTVAIKDFTRVFIFRDTGIWQADILANQSVTGEIDRTPPDWAPPLPGAPSLVFSIDQYTLISETDDGIQANTVLFFVAPPNAENPNQTTEAPIYYGNIDATFPFINTGQNTSGGIIVSVPYLIKYGNNGVIYWSTSGSPIVFPSSNYYGVSAQKILTARRYQGGMLMWTASTIERVAFNAQQTVPGFTSSTAVPEISMLSPSSLVAGHNNTFFWVGNDQMYLYNGVGNTIDNDLNRNQFFESINKKYAGKVWGLYVGNFNEIWWFSPEGENTECSRLYTFQYKTNQWADNYISRTAGAPATVYRYPLLADGGHNIYSQQNVYSIWAHEKGYNAVNNGVAYPIPAWIQTKLFSVMEGNPQINVEMRLRKIERDISQVGNMEVQVYTYPYPNSEPYITLQKTFTPSDSQIDIDLSGRFISFKYLSNDIDGFFQLGHTLIDYKLGAQRPGGTY